MISLIFVHIACEGSVYSPENGKHVGRKIHNKKLYYKLIVRTLKSCR